VKLACVLFVALLGCGPKPQTQPVDPGGSIAANRIKGQAAKMDSVVYQSPALANAIGVTASVGRRGAVGNLECIARLVNRTDQPLVIQARANYYDGESMPIDDTTEYQTLTLSPRSEGAVKFASTSTTAAHYVIELGELQQ
jgi:hypothetical protein